MDVAIISLISAVSVVVVTQLFTYIRERKDHSESVQDKRDEKHDEVITEIKSLSKKVGSLEDKIDESEMKQARIRILRFEDELLHDVAHTKGHFKQTLDDIDIYERYCEEHPNFKNGYAKHAVAHIKRVYDSFEENHNFLIEQ